MRIPTHRPPARWALSVIVVALLALYGATDTAHAKPDPVSRQALAVCVARYAPDYGIMGHDARWLTLKVRACVVESD
jgi:hypothetical protein